MMALLEVVRFALVGAFEVVTPGLPLGSGQTPFWVSASAMAAATVLWLLSGFVNDVLSARLQGHAELLRVRTHVLGLGCVASDMLHLAVDLYMWLTTALVMVWSIAAAVGIFV